MRMLRVGCVLLSVLAAFPYGSTQAAATCGFGVSTVKKVLDDGNAAELVEEDKADVYTVKLGAGEHYVELLSPGDVDLKACKKSKIGWTQVCESTNPGGWDLCIAEGLDGWPGAGPPLKGPGTFQIHVLHCMASECGLPKSGAPLPYVISVQ